MAVIMGMPVTAAASATLGMLVLMILVGAAVVKLVTFDLAALDGVARVLAFLGAGLVLLTAGTRYAKLVASAKNTDLYESKPVTPPSY